MASRRDFFYLQEVQESELDGAFSAIEQAQFNLLVDLGFVGIATGAGVAQHSPTPDLTVDVAIGTAYDQQGRRMRVPSLQVVNLAVDSNAVSTAVVNPGQSKIVGLFLRFKRNLSDPRTDGNGADVNFVQDEGFEFVVVQGAEAVSPSPPSLLGDGLLLADITRTFGQTQILTANISTTRRQNTIQLTAGALTVNVGTVEEGLQALLTELNNHITGVANLHAATTISYAGGSAWFDGTTNPATNVELQLDKFITDLIAASSSPSGASRIGCHARTTWLGGRTNPNGVSLFAAVDKIITDLAATSSNDDGAERIGAQASGNLAIGSVRSQLDELDAEKGGLATSNAWTNTNSFAADVTLNKSGSQLLQVTNAVTAFEIDWAKVAGTGATNGLDILVDCQDGQNQTGGNANNHGGGIEFSLGQPGTGGSGAAGRSGQMTITAAPLIKTFELGSGAAISILTTATGTILEWDRAVEGGSAGNLFLVEADILAVEVSAPPQQMGAWTLKGTFKFESGAWSLISTLTTVHSKTDLTGGTLSPTITSSGTKLQVKLTAGAEDVTATAWLRIRRMSG